MRNLLTLLISFLISLVAIAQDSSFKKYKKERTGEITAYAGGLPFLRYETNLDFNRYAENEKSVKKYDPLKTDLRPIYKQGAYYLFLQECPFDIDGSRGFGETKDGFFKLMLYLKTDKGDILEIVATKKAPFDFGFSQIDFKEFKFYLTKEQFLKICYSTNLEVDFSSAERDSFEDFQFKFDYVDLTGYRDFVEGMGWEGQ